MKAIAPEPRGLAGAARVLSAQRDSAVGRGGTIASGRRVDRSRQESDSAADAAGLKRLDCCVSGPKQPSASRGETTGTVALRSPAPSRPGDRIPSEAIAQT